MCSSHKRSNRYQILTSCSKILLQKIIIALSHSTNSQLIMEPEILFPCSQEIAIGPYSCELNAVHILPFYFFKINFNRILVTMLKSSK
jgi:hypothetical protein